MNKSLDADALSQLGREQKALLDTIDGLRGLGVELDTLPQIIVVGDKSSGKSSVLEAISRIPFPVKSGLCTRSPTELVLRTAAEPRFAVRLRSQNGGRDAPFHKELATKDDLPSIIEEAKEEMGIGVGTKDFSDETLNIEISGPDLPHLTLVDLPGLYRTETKDESDEGIEMVRSLAKRYMSQKNTIILAVVSASNDAALQEILKLAKTYDPSRERTIGVITKPDSLEPSSPEESAFIRLAQNQDPVHSFKLGWHILRNRSSLENDENNAGQSKTSDEERDEKEREFLSSGSWTSIPVLNRGVEALRHKLSAALTQHIQSSLPDLIASMDQKLKTNRRELMKLGEPRTTDSERRQFIFSVANQYREIAYASTRGLYDGKFFRTANQSTLAAPFGGYDERRLRAVVRNLNCAFHSVMVTKGARRNIWFPDTPIVSSDPVSASYKSWIALFNSISHPTNISWTSVERELEAAAANSMGNQFPGSPSDGVALELFRDQVHKWPEIASQYLDLVLRAAKIFVQSALDHILGANKTTKDALYNCYVDGFFEARKFELDAKLKELTHHYVEGDIICLEEEFHRRIAKQNKQHLATHIKTMLPEASRGGTWTKDDVVKAVEEAPSDRMDSFGLKRVFEMMDAYYQMSLRTFTDNVIILAAENCLVAKIPDLLKSIIDKDMEPDMLAVLADEPRLISQERKRLRKQVSALEEGLRICEKNRPLMGSLLPNNVTAQENENVPPPQADRNLAKSAGCDQGTSSSNKDTSASVKASSSHSSSLETKTSSSRSGGATPSSAATLASGGLPGGINTSSSTKTTTASGGLFGGGNVAPSVMTTAPSGGFFVSTTPNLEGSFSGSNAPPPSTKTISNPFTFPTGRTTAPSGLFGGANATSSATTTVPSGGFGFGHLSSRSAQTNISSVSPFGQAPSA
ncbi:hypothetical protein C2857_006874 [Epichloe festucae Fl1]|uniref:Uncharacterized protein n=1 Tax=Epichloe festucae (strain Fl1) TaxID=877507 RepID=A0A7S9KLY2_EPIFF|nr:hypothetical protein C2857_006874 [Epichloe festucae Fl1]